MRSDFEATWRRRFQEFALDHEDDAGIAGWSEAGLQARLRNFIRSWRPEAPDALWLDAGCGAGTYARVIASADQRVIGLDYSLPSLVKARQRLPEESILFVAGDVTSLPLTTDSFDGAICFGVLQALASPDRAVAELARVTRPGGRVWVDALNAGCIPNATTQALARIRGHASRMRYDSAARLRKLFTQHGFRDIRITWVPIVPLRYRRFQAMFESRSMRALFGAVPPFASALSHAFVLAAERGERTKFQSQVA